MDVGAQSQAMGGASLAHVRDASAIQTNPSNLTRLDRSELFVYYGRLPADYLYNYAAYSRPWKGNSVGVSMTYLDKGTFDGRDENRRPTGDFSASDTMLTLSAARPLGPRLSLGGSVKFIQSQIKNFIARGSALDLAASYQMSPRMRLAAGLFHIGPTMKYQNEPFALPATAAAGVSRQFGRLGVASDLRYGLKNQRLTLSLGGELGLGNVAAVRMGYISRVAQGGDKVGNQNSGVEMLTGLGMGLGFRFFSLARLDYAFVPLGELGGTHHMNIVVRFK